ncbi:MAG: DUF3179 domain-containing protein [Wenzhouxiangellaceae bacterium]
MIRQIVLIVLAGAALSVTAAEEERPRNRFDSDILVETFGYGPETPSTVEWEALYQGCPKRDCIPAIDEPRFISAEEADYLQADELVLGMAIEGDARAYPVRIMNFHEIVNDQFGDLPVAVTFCPLCGSGVAFDRRLDGEAVEFGVSGVLHDSDLVMYDRRSESLWQQITGAAIMGPKLGETLTMLPLSMSEWSTWKAAYPQTRVLTVASGQDLGERGGDYGRDVYKDYLTSDRLYFPVARRNLAVPPKTVIHGAVIASQAVALRDDELAPGEQRTFALADLSLRVRRAEDGGVVFHDAATETDYPAMRLFWFAWYNFHPDTELVSHDDAAE